MWVKAATRSLIFAASLWATPAFGQTVDDSTRAAARDIGYAGVEAFQRGDYTTANQKLDKAYRVLRAPSLGLWSARALAKLGRLVEAAERYREVLRLSPTSGDQEVQKRAQADAELDLATLMPRLSGITVVLKGAQASETTISIDGVPVSAELVGENRPVNPGAHRVEGRRGSDQAVVELKLAEGEKQQAVLEFTPGAASAAPVTPAVEPASSPGSSTSPSGADRGSSSTMRTLGWVAVGVGGAGLALGGVTGLLALGERGNIEDSPDCDAERNVCLASKKETVDSYQTLRLVSGIGFIAGGVLAATGVILLVTAPDSRSEVALGVGPASVSLRGKF
jgi:hypothetical protein